MVSTALNEGPYDAHMFSLTDAICHGVCPQLFPSFAMINQLRNHYHQLCVSNCTRAHLASTQLHTFLCPFDYDPAVHSPGVNCRSRVRTTRRHDGDRMRGHRCTNNWQTTFGHWSRGSCLEIPAGQKGRHRPNFSILKYHCLNPKSIQTQLPQA